jgi:hypothetical protein
MRPHKVQITPEQLRQANNDLMAGDKFEDVAARCGLSKSAMYYRFLGAGLPTARTPELARTKVFWDESVANKYSSVSLRGKHESLPR